jgi:hypothetical protein
LSNYININIEDEIEGGFKKWVITHPIYMHEFGHSLDSRQYGLLYLIYPGLPSLISSSEAFNRQVRGEEIGVFTHIGKPYEIRATKLAKKYFSLYYDVDWNSPWYGHSIYTYETFYPTKKRW